MVFGGEGFGKRLGAEGRALMDEINVLIKEIPERSLALFTCEVTGRRL